VVGESGDVTAGTRVDRTTGVTGAIYSQFLPFIPPEALQLYADVETALYATL
jgi:methyl acetate hydrolase